MQAEEAMEAATREITQNIYFANLDKFLDAMFPFMEASEQVFQELCKDGTYIVQNKKWANIPPEHAAESNYYPWFSDLAEKIKKAYLNVTGINEGDCAFLNKWTVNNTLPRAVSDDLASLVRPHISNVVLSREERNRQDPGRDFENELMEKQAAMIKARNNSQKSKTEQADLLRKLSIWWSRINVVVEMKKKVHKTPLDDIKQLVCHLQHVLREQLDRRSAIGILFCKSELAVWHADRSGVFGTDQAFDVHLRPQKFIQVILGCSFGKPSILGFDTSMRLWLPTKRDVLPSYHPDVTCEDYQRNILEKNWMISMPRPSGKPSDREDFLTIHAISTFRASNISGKATVVWVAMKFEDRGTKNHKIYVLKQCWRPEGTSPEVFLIPEGVDNVTKVYSYEDVCDEEDIEVNTVAYLRHGQGYISSMPQSEPKKLVSQVAQDDKVETSETRTLVFVLLNQEIEMERHIPIPRVQSRLVMEDYGWPIHQFQNLLELLKVLEEVVAAQKTLYLQHRTLQRDISVGNILIVPSRFEDHEESENDLDSTHACLIDYDYAKRADSEIPSTLGTLDQLASRLEGEGSWYTKRDIADVRKQLQRYWDIHPELDNFLPAYLKCRNLVHSTLELLNLNKAPDTIDQLTAVRLGLLDKDTKIPDFRNTKAEARERIVTTPFASCEVLAGNRLFPEGDPRPLLNHTSADDFEDYLTRPGGSRRNHFHHDAAQDLEALLWVLTYICLTRSGPGGVRRKELEKDPKISKTEPISTLHNLCRGLFSDTNWSQMAFNKRSILYLKKGDHKKVTDSFTEYFEPIKDLWNQWRTIIRIAHTHPIIDGVHDLILAAIKATIVEVAKVPERLQEDAKRVTEERRKQLKFFRNFLADMENPQSKTRPLIPPHDLSTSETRRSILIDTRGEDGRTGRLQKLPKLDLTT